jgi:hypothetical protein
MATFSLHVLTPKKLECGECRECCIAFPLEPHPDYWPDGKPTNQPCTFLCDKGCGIHDDPNRPKVCCDFVCSWVDGQFGMNAPDWRPDKLGLIVSWGRVEKIRVADMQNVGGACFQIMEAKPGRIVEIDPHALRYRLGRRVGYDAVKVIPYGLDHKKHNVQVMEGGNVFCCFNADDAASEAYADKVLDWWKGCLKVAI